MILAVEIAVIFNHLANQGMPIKGKHDIDVWNDSFYSWELKISWNHNNKQTESGTAEWSFFAVIF